MKIHDTLRLLKQINQKWNSIYYHSIINKTINETKKHDETAFQQKKDIYGTKVQQKKIHRKYIFETHEKIICNIKWE